MNIWIYIKKNLQFCKCTFCCLFILSFFTKRIIFQMFISLIFLVFSLKISRVLFLKRTNIITFGYNISLFKSCLWLKFVLFLFSNLENCLCIKIIFLTFFCIPPKILNLWFNIYIPITYCNKTDKTFVKFKQLSIWLDLIQSSVLPDVIRAALIICQHPSQTRTGFPIWPWSFGSGATCSEQLLQNILPQFRQWCWKSRKKRSVESNGTLDNNM